MLNPDDALQLNLFETEAERAARIRAQLDEIEEVRKGFVKTHKAFDVLSTVIVNGIANQLNHALNGNRQSAEAFPPEVVKNIETLKNASVACYNMMRGMAVHRESYLQVVGLEELADKLQSIIPPIDKQHGQD
jgi:hypothetical protein